MADLLGRIVRITIAAPVATPGDFTHTTTDQVQISDDDGTSDPSLRCAFKIIRTSEKEPNTSEIKIYNVSPRTRALAMSKGGRLMLEAGYKTTGFSRFWVGDIRVADPIRDGRDWVLTIKLGDGERSYRFAQMTESWGAGTRAGDVLKSIASATGLELGNVEQQAAKIDTVFDQGYAVAGRAYDAMARLVESLGHTLSVQDGKLQMLAPGASIDEGDVPLLSPDTGLIGSPEMGVPEKKGKPPLLKYKALLFPTRPGKRVHIKSEKYDGEFINKKVTFTGDTAGGDWYTEGEAVKA